MDQNTQPNADNLEGEPFGVKLRFLLSQPFGEDEIEWRIQSSGTKRDKSPWARVIPYVTARAIDNRLDDVFGIMGWTCSYREQGSGTICRIKVTVPNATGGITSVSKEDGAADTDIEGFKGGLSSAKKRAAVQFGIGRYLYKIPEYFAKFEPQGKKRSKVDGVWHKWTPPALPAWAKPQPIPETPVPPETPAEPVQTDKQTPKPPEAPPVDPVVSTEEPDLLDLKMHFGKHNGVRLKDLPVHYRKWLCDKWLADKQTSDRNQSPDDQRLFETITALIARNQEGTHVAPEPDPPPPEEDFELGDEPEDDIPF